MNPRLSQAARDAMNRTAPSRNGQAKPAAKKSNRFAPINGMIDIHLRDMNKTDALLWVILWRFVDHKTGTVTISHNRIAEIAGLKRRAVINAMSRLADTGFVKVVRRGGPDQTSNVYKLTAPRN